MVIEIRLSHQRLKVLARLMDRPAIPLAGADIMRLTGLSSGSLYPILYVFEDAGLVASEWEPEAPQVLKRPRRRLYTLTAVGERAFRAATADLAPSLLTYPPLETER
jgi:PadR family transcriptional regulator PadR